MLAEGHHFRCWRARTERNMVSKLTQPLFQIVMRGVAAGAWVSAAILLYSTRDELTKCIFWTNALCESLAVLTNPSPELTNALFWLARNPDGKHPGHSSMVSGMRLASATDPHCKLSHTGEVLHMGALCKAGPKVANDGSLSGRPLSFVPVKFLGESGICHCHLSPGSLCGWLDTIGGKVLATALG